MNHDITEFNAIAAAMRAAGNDASATAAKASATAPRFDSYVGIHKGLRALMSDTLLAVGRMDPHDALEVGQTCQRVLELLDFCISHLTHENEFIHAAIEARAPGAATRIAHEHDEHRAEVAELNTLVGAVLNADAGERSGAALALYRALAVFVGANYLHMNVEETEHNRMLWQHYTDEEIVAMHDALVASIPPEEMMYVVRWVVPFLNPLERAGMLADMRAKAPAPAFQAALDVARPQMSDREWAKLSTALGLPAVPGLVEAM